MPIAHHFCPDFPSIPSNLDGASSYTGKGICIIGAGVSGLSAAMSLQRMGLGNRGKQQLTVLEASDRIGGRLKRTDGSFIEKEGGVPLDLGAEWIHSTRGADVLKQIMDFGDGNDESVVPELIAYQPEFHFMQRKAPVISWAYQEAKFKATTWYDWVQKHMYEPVKDCVELNSPVIKVDYSDNSGDGVVLTMKDGSTRSFDRVICTAPLAVLKAGGIEFNPPIPDSMKQAMDKIEMPPGFRVAFRMKENFYKDLSVYGSFFGLLTDPDDLFLLYDMLWGKDLGEDVNVLACVAIGSKNAGEWSKLPDDELVEKIMARIDELYDGQGTKNLIGKPAVQNWGSEPYVHGAYTFSAPAKYFNELAKPLGFDGRDSKTNTVFFAGEHTSAKFHSLVPGAACEGRRAALEVARSLLK